MTSKSNKPIKRASDTAVFLPLICVFLLGALHLALAYASPSAALAALAAPVAGLAALAALAAPVAGLVVETPQASALERVCGGPVPGALLVVCGLAVLVASAASAASAGSAGSGVGAATVAALVMSAVAPPVALPYVQRQRCPATLLSKPEQECGHPVTLPHHEASPYSLIPPA